MSRAISQAARTALYAEETGDAFPLLLTIDHAALPLPIRVTNNGVALTSRGDVFKACAFEIDLPGDTDDGVPSSRLSVDNVDQQIMASIRSIAALGPPDMLLEIVRAASPDTVEGSWPMFKLRNVVGDRFTVTGQFTVEHLFNEPYPAQRFTPALWPGLF